MSKCVCVCAFMCASVFGLVVADEKVLHASPYVVSASLLWRSCKEKGLVTLARYS